MLNLFSGGGSIFFSKSPHQHEVINDKDIRVLNFYEVLINNFEDLQKLISVSLHSEHLHSISRAILKNIAIEKKSCQHEVTLDSCLSCNINCELKRAWAFWTQIHMSFSGQIGAGFGFSLSNKRTLSLKNKRNSFQSCYKERLEMTEIFCRDALDLIKLKDNEDTFFYFDPPYFQAHMGHYGDYTKQDFISLLEVCSSLNGSFLLSSYDSDILQEFVKKNGWQQKIIELSLTAQKKANGEIRERRFESLVFNYNPLLEMWDC